MAFVALLAASAVGLLSHPIAPSVAAHASPKEFCASPGPRDYAAPLAKLPAINHVPPPPKKHPGRGNLPFGPGTVEMYVDTEGPVIVNPERFGFAFWDVGFLGNKPESEPEFNWRVTAQLMALDSSGAVVDEIAHGQIEFGRINDAYQPDLNLPVPHRLGFYRYDIQIADAEGHLLGSYGEYLRVVPPSVKVRLGISARRFRPGQTLAARLEELGTDWISFGAEFEVQRRSGGVWRSYPPLTPEIWEAWEAQLGLGGAGPCSYIHIPARTPAGHYRVVKRIGVSAGAKHGRELTLTAPFVVSRR